MKTTLDLPDDLMREVKVLAAQSDRKLKDLLAELLQNGMAKSKKRPPTHPKSDISAAGWLLQTRRNRTKFGTN